MPTLEESTKRNYKALRNAFFTHPSDSEKYFIISGESLKEMDIFDIQQGLQDISKDKFKTAMRLQSGDILVQTKDIHQINALKATKIFGKEKKPVSISENGVLNQSQAIIRCKELTRVKEERIIAQMGEQNVIGVQKIKRKDNGQWINTATHILTFSTPTCPAEVNVGYLTVKTEIYIPSPFRCVICQKLGHTKKRCNSKKNRPKCGICAQDSHEPDFIYPCNLPKCVNCLGAHPSHSKACPKYIEEREVNAIRVTLRIPYNLAREELKRRKGVPNPILNSYPNSVPSKSISYAQTVSKSEGTSTVSTDSLSKRNNIKFNISCATITACLRLIQV
ncbi:uncharacterized protein LOC129786930 [Lutzomyia longipalpis]|uniref:uncharacterized protein LOC129786930 n=1 Tax=Lutzomyia longipalpis TaxID=7200 RepID=UPI002483AD88|nr:uncharacterized protein LOC129786930 [Lutzomyia longipalpis]